VTEYSDPAIPPLLRQSPSRGSACLPPIGAPIVLPTCQIRWAMGDGRGAMVDGRWSMGDAIPGTGARTTTTGLSSTEEFGEKRQQRQQPIARRASTGRWKSGSLLRTGYCACWGRCHTLFSNTLCVSPRPELLVLPWSIVPSRPARGRVARGVEGITPLRHSQQITSPRAPGTTRPPRSPPPPPLRRAVKENGRCPGSSPPAVPAGRHPIVTPGALAKERMAGS
jgi:hypothetical protein